MNGTNPFLSLNIESEAALHQLAARLAPVLRRGDCLALTGTLGAGKTSFMRGLIRALSAPNAEVASPTFTLLQSYNIQMQGKPATCWHADLYRLESFDAVEQLGLPELPAEGLLCVEWPQIAGRLLPRARLHIELQPGSSPEARRVHFSAANGDWPVRLSGLHA